MEITSRLPILAQDRSSLGVNLLSAQSLPGKLSPDLSQALHGIKAVRVYPKGATLFQQGSAVSGVYVVESGLVRVLLPTLQNRLQLLGHAGPGTILGLSETMSGDRYRVTAEAGDHTTVAFIPRESFVEFLRDHCEFCMQVVRLLSEDLHGLYHKFRSISAHPGRPRHRSPDEQLN
jgi:CRP-like cAMP-binding protein